MKRKLDITPAVKVKVKKVAHFERIDITWDYGDGSKSKGSILRMKVPGGWLVSHSGYLERSLCFYPDPKHKWDGKDNSGIDFREVPENEGCMKQDDWPHASIGRLEAANKKEVYYDKERWINNNEVWNH